MKEGESTNREKENGYLGSMDLSAAPNLHYEVCNNGKPVDPEKYFEYV